MAVAIAVAVARGNDGDGVGAVVADCCSSSRVIVVYSFVLGKSFFVMLFFLFRRIAVNFRGEKKRFFFWFSNVELLLF